MNKELIFKIIAVKKYKKDESILDILAIFDNIINKYSRKLNGEDTKQDLYVFLIKLIKKKDHRGIDYIVDLYSDKISYIVNSILNGYSNKEDIEECISDVFISVYNDIHTYDNKKGKFETFVFIKAKYIALDYKRKIIKKKEYEKIKEDRLLKINENIAYESAEKEVIKKEKLKDIANFINNLKEPDKTYFYLKYFINMESKEIAKKYNTTLSSVENRLYRCRLALKKIIDGGV